MKFIHLSDLHLGKRVHDFSLIEDQKYILKEILEVIDDELPDAVIIAGDIYDKSIPSTDAVEMLDEFLYQLSGRNLQVFLISGNHDSPERLAFASRLIAPKGIHMSPVYNGEIGPIVLTDEFGPVDVYLLPFVKPAHVRRFFPDEKIESYNDALRAAVQALKIDRSRRNILVTHQFITGAVRSDSEEISVGGTDNIDASVFEGFDYVALGHIHKPQDVNDRIRYCGTPMAYSFGKEEEQKKSVTVIDTETMERRTVQLHPLHRRTTLTGTLDELMDPKEDEDVVKGFIRLRVTDKPVGLASLTQLREIYPLLIECESRSFESDESSIKLTVEEYEEMQTDPVKVFESFCIEMCDGEPSEHLRELFVKAVNMSGEEEQ